MNSLDNPKGIKSTIAMAFSICLGAFSFSFNLVCLTEIADLLQIKNNIQKDQLVFQLSIATSAFTFGALISPFLYTKYVKWLGQLKGLLVIDLIAIIMMLVELTELRFEILAGCRFFLGLVLGLSIAIIPVHLNSIAPPSMTGKLGTYNQLFQTSGVMFAYCFGLILDKDPDDEIRWRFFLGFPIIGLVLRIIALQVFFPYNALERHIQNGEDQKLKEYCMMVYEDDGQEIINSLIAYKSIEKVQEENKSTYKRRVILGVVLIAANQFTGINGILYYAKQLFGKVTQNQDQYSEILTIQLPLSLLQVISTLISSEIVDKVGRRTLLIRGQIIIMVILLGVFAMDQIGGKFGQIAVVFLLFGHILAMNLTLGSVCIIYCSDILTDLTWVIFTLKLCAFTVALTTEYMIEYLGIGLMFMVYFVLSAGSFAFLRPRLVQTTGLTRAEVYAKFQYSHSEIGQQAQQLSPYAPPRNNQIQF